MKQLLWREYFQRLQQHFPDVAYREIKPGQSRKRGMPLSVMLGKTGITVLDDAISTLYLTGHMHNHVRLYIASLCCTLGKCHFNAPAAWMYYHLSDGDVASNFGSWQWVAGTLTGKPYHANQNNVNEFTHVKQYHTFLDTAYEELAVMQIPDVLRETCQPILETILPDTGLPQLEQGTTLLYTHYNLDPFWHMDDRAERLLVLEPSHFKKFPISEFVLKFIITLTGNLQGIKLYCGEIDALKRAYPDMRFLAREHPLFAHWDVAFDEREWIVPEVKGFYPSFSKYYKDCQKKLSVYEHR
jgi:deoxyribodipyrimidine photo-lyase